jgi:predicted CopG family antitoxin
LAKTVRVHDDTHRVLKEIKNKRRANSIDEVIRELVRKSTGTPVEETKEREDAGLESFAEDVITQK